MNTHEGKSQNNKSKAVANNLRTNLEGNLSAFEFADNRPVTIAQRKFQENVNDGAELKQRKAKNESVQKKENNTGLPDDLKSGIENLSGISMDDVKVHYNSSQPSELNALAYAQGTNIHVAPGQEKHLPHEAWHVVQQAQGRVKPTLQMKSGANINDDKGLEREADVMGVKALQLSNARLDIVALKNYSSSVQRRSYSTISHSGDCPCSNCYIQLMQNRQVGNTIQLKTSVSITDKQVTKTGESGNEERAQKYIGEWPSLRKSFDDLVHPVDMAVLDEEGEATGEIFSRNRYMCAEPDALGLLLHVYDNKIRNHNLGSDFLSKVSFPALAVDDKTGKNIKPCPVCQQWITSDAPMAIKFQAEMENKKGIEEEKEYQRLQVILDEERIEEQKKKDLKKKLLAEGRTSKEQKNATSEVLKNKISSDEIFKMLNLSLLKTKKKLTKDEIVEAKKEMTDGLFDAWINSLETTDIRAIIMIENFDGGHKEEFQRWYGQQ